MPWSPWDVDCFLLQLWLGLYALNSECLFILIKCDEIQSNWFCKCNLSIKILFKTMFNFSKGHIYYYYSYYNVYEWISTVLLCLDLLYVVHVLLLNQYFSEVVSQVTWLFSLLDTTTCLFFNLIPFHVIILSFFKVFILPSAAWSLIKWDNWLH